MCFGLVLVSVVSFVGLAQAADSRSDLAAALQTPAALQSRIRFDRFTTADGLSNDAVFCILQDRHGFLWFGTQAGLNRYDGYRVKQYRHDPRNPNSLGGDFVSTLLEDSRGAIWTGDPGRLDPQTDTFTRYALPHALSVQGRPVSLQKILDDRAGFIWLGFSGGRNLYRLDPGTGKLSSFDIGGGLPANIDIAIKSMYRDGAGILWLGASTRLSAIRSFHRRCTTLLAPVRIEHRRTLQISRRTLPETSGWLQPGMPRTSSIQFVALSRGTGRRNSVASIRLQVQYMPARMESCGEVQVTAWRFSTPPPAASRSYITMQRTSAA